ncbi:MAG: rRNA maturation RNase YbeY [bacterium]|nr:rRNA maturation RNase YbeY [bacterium]
MLEINNTTGEKINAPKLRAIAEKFARVYKSTGDKESTRDKGSNKKTRNISLAIVGPARIKSHNLKYRGLNKATDVLSFKKEKEIIINISETKKPERYWGMLAELGMDIKTAIGATGKITAETGATGTAQKKRLSEYLLYFLFVHGLLHLAGYDDKTEPGRREMIKKGRDFLKKIGLRYP